MNVPKKLALSFSSLFLIALLFSFSAEKVYADRITHKLSGLCVHPKGGSLHPKNRTNIVLHGSGCTLQETRLDFVLDNNRIKHVASGKCVHPKGGAAYPKEHTELVLYNGCTEDKTYFELTPSGKIKHFSGKCIHPLIIPIGHSSSHGLHLKNSTLLVLETDCYGKVAEFTLGPPPPRDDSVATTKLFHVSSGKCTHPKHRPSHVKNGTELVLHGDDCGVPESRLYFTILRNGAIKHVYSGKCVHPKGGELEPSNRTKLVLYEGCEKRAVQFRYLPQGTIQHQSSGKCIHPRGGSFVPGNGTNLVLYDACQGDNIKFEFNQ